jgi:hypothetical protein
MKLWQFAVLAVLLWFAVPRYRVRAISLLLLLLLVGTG